MASTLSIVLMAVGVVALVAGLVMVGFTAEDQGQNEEQPFSGDDEDRAERNEQLRLAGWFIAGAGLVLALIGIVMRVSGRKA